MYQRRLRACVRASVISRRRDYEMRYDVPAAGSIDSCVNNVLSRHTIERKLHRKEGRLDDEISIWLSR